MKKYFALVLVLTSLTVCSQDQKFVKPDYKAIKKEVADKNSTFFYKKLEEKFNAADSTMTLEEKRHLYYGFTNQDRYSSFYTGAANDSLRSVLNKEVLETEDFKKIITYGSEVLNENPFDIRTLNIMSYAYEKQSNLTEAKNKAIQIGIIVEAIFSTGDGTSKENAFFVINVPHEYDIISVLGFEFGGKQSLIEGTYDYLTLAENPYGLKGFYFDMSPSFNKLAELLKD
ncbi:DUF4919 domain-containing protein [Flavobacterium sp. IMCC34852]|uniref:DUF4919 domain-containing protein n=1 Tax=Flavobacterium rivulicola TaxID=2732161 RepID=A0A7Y3R8K1_9FLAO|nr:DUF4919 domain-containing protein [Flavobacterium sp. IMCC34852]NNT71515.1 DUF4919 domain-containing protein [Flavobacterium sp. IMCC34852]